MKPIPFTGQTHTFVAPKDWDVLKDGVCGELPVQRDEAANTYMSVWEPNAIERHAIATGVNIVLTVCGGQPPVSIRIAR